MSYPIRFSQSMWIIPLCYTHECSELCHYTIAIIREIIGDNFDEIECHNKNRCLHHTIPLSSFDLSYSHYQWNHIDDVVIPDLSYTIYITFPLNYHCPVEINRITPTTLRDLVWIIKNIYQEIYDIEEKTAEPTEHRIIKTCECVNYTIHQKIKNISPSDNPENCSICFLPLDGKSSEPVEPVNPVEPVENSSTSGDLCQLYKCNHIFHVECMNKWITTGKETCPLCRQLMFVCSYCNNTKIVYISEYHVVVPKNKRIIKTARNTTNGRFGIFDYDMDRLKLDNIIYNNVSKSVFISININQN